MKQARVVILGGTPRAGKTTLAVRMARNGFSKISFDHLSEAIRKGFPEIQIEDWTCQETCARRIFPFFESIVKSAVDDAQVYGLNTVIDMYDFTPEYVSKLPFQKDIAVYFLAYPSLSVDEIRHNIKHYSNPTDWIAQVDDDYLDVVAKRCSIVNEKLARQCKDYSYRLIDTSAGWERNTVLEGLFNEIMSSTQKGCHD